VENDPLCRGAVFRINSPGGSVVASREMAGYVKSMKKPSVCWLGDVAASGAYWVASSCDVIVADDLSLTGSVGVTASYLEFSKLFEKYGITYEQITSGSAKDMGSPYRNMTPEERERMKDIVDQTFTYFIKDVMSNRNLTMPQADKIAEGDIFLGSEAIKLGLVDRLGSFEDAKSVAENMTGIRNAEFFEFRKKGLGLLDLLSLL
jgi:protease-4